MSMRTSRVQIDTKTRLIVSAVLLLSTFISLGSQTMMVTALPVISHQMHVSLNITQLLTTAYTLVIGIVTPLSICMKNTVTAKFTLASSGLSS